MIKRKQGISCWNKTCSLSTSAFPKETIKNLQTEALKKIDSEFNVEQPKQYQNEDQPVDSDPEIINPQADKSHHTNQPKYTECNKSSTSPNGRCKLCLCKKTTHVDNMC